MLFMFFFLKRRRYLIKIITRDNDDRSINVSHSNTIFDDIFRTLCDKNPKLLIPLINEIFSQNYSIDEKLDSLSNEHYSILSQNKNGIAEKITDSCIRLHDKLYHIECQSSHDGTMILRMVEYDFFIAVNTAIKEQDYYRLSFPHSAVLYLRSNNSTPDTMNMLIDFPDKQQVTYQIPIIKLHTYTKDDVIHKQLFFFIPYYILKYEKEIKNHDDTALKKMKSEFIELKKGLETAKENGIIKQYDMTNIFDLTVKLVDYISQNNVKVREEVNSVMGGKVLETLGDKLLQVEEQLKALDDIKVQLDNQKTQLDNQKTQLDNEKTQLDNQKTQLNNEKTQLNNREVQLNNREKTLDAIEKNLSNGQLPFIIPIIETCREFNATKEYACNKIISNYSVTSEEAHLLVNNYWK